MWRCGALSSVALLWMVLCSSLALSTAEGATAERELDSASEAQSAAASEEALRQLLRLFRWGAVSPPSPLLLPAEGTFKRARQSDQVPLGAQQQRRAFTIGSEFLGKRASWTPLDARQAYEEEDPEEVKRMGSEFLGKKRMGSEFLGKRMGSEFLGKRRKRSPL